MKQKPVVVLLMDRYFASIHKAISDYAVQAGWMLDATMGLQRNAMKPLGQMRLSQCIRLRKRHESG